VLKLWQKSFISFSWASSFLLLAESLKAMGKAKAKNISAIFVKVL
jgi:hypothetical protein